MIGSGVLEAACKTRVAQRLTQSAMRQSAAGAKAILTPHGRDGASDSTKLGLLSQRFTRR